MLAGREVNQAGITSSDSLEIGAVYHEVDKDELEAGDLILLENRWQQAKDEVAMSEQLSEGAQARLMVECEGSQFELLDITAGEEARAVKRMRAK